MHKPRGLFIVAKESKSSSNFKTENIRYSQSLYTKDKDNKLNIWRMLCNGSIPACGAVGVGPIPTFRFFMLRSESASMLRRIEQESMKIIGVKIK